MFNGCRSISSLDVRTWGMNKVTTTDGMFWNCSLLSTLNTSEWASLDKVVGVDNMLRECKNLVSVDMSDKLERCTNYANYIYYDYSLRSMVGNHTETDNVRLFIGYNLSDLTLRDAPYINLATVNAVIRGVASSTIKRKLYLPDPVKSQVTDEYKTILENKNWVIQ